jgi:hypothetical protein
MKTIYGDKPKTELEARCAAVSRFTPRTCRRFAKTKTICKHTKRAGIAGHGSRSMRCPNVAAHAGGTKRTVRQGSEHIERN